MISSDRIVAVFYNLSGELIDKLSGPPIYINLLLPGDLVKHDDKMYRIIRRVFCLDGGENQNQIMLYVEEE